MDDDAAFYCPGRGDDDDDDNNDNDTAADDDSSAICWRPMTSGTSADLSNVWGSSATAVYAVGIEYSTMASAILHYDGSTWTAVGDAPAPAATIFDAVWGSSATDVYAVGYDEGSSTGVILHYDGAAWTLAVNATGGWRPHEVFGSSASDVYTLGTEIGAMMHYDGASWTTMAGASDVSLNIERRLGRGLGRRF